MITEGISQRPKILFRLYTDGMPRETAKEMCYKGFRQMVESDWGLESKFNFQYHEHGEPGNDYIELSATFISKNAAKE